MNNPSHQDWAPVVLRKGGGGGGGGGASGGQRATGIQAKRTTNMNASAHAAGPSNAAKLDAENEAFAHKSVDKSLSKAIMQARLAKKMNQKQLATAINEKPQIIQEYETGKAIPNQQIIGKLERALGCQLRQRKKKGGKK
uniref:HTH cro/C1-type domain-containing protein n=1 Tax=Rhizochromulina marina TaxID=1034831 RepID=A0A7S2SAV4_9STRA|mmetsp:Transcript_27509/g.80298  ORF Transcript_27509/g.80298 Transcript_27509/m.80298 type:complete len:140 (+) Transcript_27509:86-505(+)|eukprot:CAMPEP_0118961564 /NCGR_PEP_ID=MMETSP1173-20130426/205_1 /TAXON_ID=1034831 /ORGANISM="Rhizochromulina marina cf, Strain CCMP1243" /LENGTH=139 /DNA_ID=CAMNT_0006909743 /DNA_START=90 /DNA_END=509 /DNA_ORIENTATION=+